MSSLGNLISSLQKLNTDTSSEMVYLTVDLVDELTQVPLKFKVNDRVVIDENFFILSKFEDWTKMGIGNRVLAFAFNKGQKFYVIERLGG